MKSREGTAPGSNPSRWQCVSGVPESRTERAHSTHPAAPRETAKHVQVVYHTLCNEKSPARPPPKKNPQFNCILLGMSSEEPTPKRKPAVEDRSTTSHPGNFFIFFISLGFFSPLTASWFSHLNQLAVGNGVLSARHHIASSIHSIFLSLGSNKEALPRAGVHRNSKKANTGPKVCRSLSRVSSFPQE